MGPVRMERTPSSWYQPSLKAENAGMSIRMDIPAPSAAAGNLCSTNAGWNGRSGVSKYLFDVWRANAIVAVRPALD